MKKLLLILSLLVSQLINAQCDTTIVNCPLSCNVIERRAPDIKQSTSGYTWYKDNCVDYDYTVGTLLNANQDDVYTAQITIGFPFRFYSSVYNTLTVSTNGYVSFDNSLGAGYFSHFGMLDDGGGGVGPYSGTPINLPSDRYDRALIMAYHDMNIAAGTSVNSRISYYRSGVAPNRKFTVTYFQLPLYSPAFNLCELLINNSQQIVIHESGLIEIKILNKQICTIWNEGRAMIGLQDFTRTQGIMAKRASDAPWTETGTWRFVPNTGPARYQSSTLLPFNVQAVPVFNNDGRVLLRYPVCSLPVGTTQCISRTLYTGGFIADDTFDLNIIAADPILCSVLALKDSDRIVITPTYYEFSAMTRGIHKVQMWNMKGQLLYEANRHFNIGGNIVNFNIRKSGVIVMRITDPMTRKVFTKTYYR